MISNNNNTEPYRRTLTAKEVMLITHHKTRAAFWNFVWANSLPAIRLNARRIVFDAGAIDAWLASRSTGRTS
jgi:predicted DNA-binding transcriptional regulator AlpA